MNSVTIEQLNGFIQQAFPGFKARVEKLDRHFAKLRHPISQSDLRPGGTVSGPTLFAVADAALYMAILNEIGLKPLAVTTNLNMNFLNKPDAQCDLIADCRLIKVGKRLIMGDVFIYSEGVEDPVAHATGTYSIPPAHI